MLSILSQPILADESVKSEEITIYRSPSCSCCGKWSEHIQTNQFSIKTVITDDMQSIKAKYGIPDKLASCHTALVNGYVIEGHVPANDIKKLLQLKPDVVGISAPRMPLGSPGMETEGQKQAYQVVTFDKQGKMTVFAEHDGN
jgi:hypothetical protein